MFKSQKPILIGSSIVFIFALCFINVTLTVNNWKLNSSVNQNLEKKSVLRAQYLSKISPNNLAYRADNFDMSLPSSNVFTVKKKEAQRISNRSKKSFLQKFDLALKNTRNVVGGY